MLSGVSSKEQFDAQVSKLEKIVDETTLERGTIAFRNIVSRLASRGLSLRNLERTASAFSKTENVRPEFIEDCYEINKDRITNTQS